MNREGHRQAARLDTRRLLLFLVFAFAPAWTLALVIYLSGGLSGSPVLIPGAGITLAAALLLLSRHRRP